MFESLDLTTTGGTLGHRIPKIWYVVLCKQTENYFQNCEGSKFNDFLDKMKVEGYIEILILNRVLIRSHLALPLI